MKKHNKSTFIRKTDAQALENARTHLSPRTDAVVKNACIKRGFLDAIPRENVLTYDAWKALGRQVKRDEKAISYMSFVKDEKTGKLKATWPKVFHISQTEVAGTTPKPEKVKNSVPAKMLDANDLPAPVVNTHTLLDMIAKLTFELEALKEKK